MPSAGSARTQEAVGQRRGSPAPQSLPAPRPVCVTRRGVVREELFVAEHTPSHHKQQRWAAELEAMRASEETRWGRGHLSGQAQSEMAPHVFPYATVIYFLLQKGMQTRLGGKRAGKAGQLSGHRVCGCGQEAGSRWWSRGRAYECVLYTSRPDSPPIPQGEERGGC